MPNSHTNRHTSAQRRSQRWKLHTLPLAAVLLWLAWSGLAGSVSADEPNQAALAILFPDGHTETRCITFDEDTINGADLLNRSGLDVLLDASSGMGITVCRVEGLGCAYPDQDCFCECMSGSGCAYWNYYYRDQGETDWTYSPLGVLLRKTQAGSVEAWVWGDGRKPPPTELSFESICAPPMPAPTHTSPLPSPGPTATSGSPSPSSPPSPAETPAATTDRASSGVVSSPTLSPMKGPTRATTAPSVTSVAPKTSSEEEVLTARALSDYWPFGLVLLGLVAIGGIVWFRRS